eukprot:UN06868
MSTNGKILTPVHQTKWSNIKDSKKRIALINHAKNALESQYASHVKTQIKNTSNSRRGKIGIEYDVHNYVYQVFKDQQIPSNYENIVSIDHYDRLPLWAIVFYCFRCGSLEGALNAARRGPQKDFGKICAALQSIIQRKTFLLPTDLWKDIGSEYNHRVKPPLCTDPFKVALYCLIAKTDTNPQGLSWKLINRHTEDYLWLRLNMVWEYDQDPPHFTPYGYSRTTDDLFSKTSLKELQQLINERKKMFFEEEQNQPLFYANITLILQQFEVCINHLEKNGHLVEAVHLALVLNYYGLLNITPSKNGEAYVNIGSLVSLLVEQIALVDCNLAFYYLYLLRLMPNKHTKQEIFDKLMVKYLSESRCDCSVVVGTVTARKVELNGSMRYFLVPEDIFNITMQAAKQAENNGSFTHAYTLYSIAGGFHEIASMLIRLVGRVIIKRPDDERKKEYMELTYRFWNTKHYHMTSHPRGRGIHRIQPEVAEDLKLSVHISDAFDSYHAGREQYNRALSIIDGTELLPERNFDTDNQGADYSVIKYGKDKQ